MAFRLDPMCHLSDPVTAGPPLARRVPATAIASVPARVTIAPPIAGRP